MIILVTVQVFFIIVDRLIGQSLNS